MRRKILMIVIAVAVLGMVLLIDTWKNDPNLVLKKLTKKLTLDSTEEVNFDYSKKTNIRRQKIPVFLFTPPEDDEYTITVSDIVTEDEVYLSMSVCDQDMNDYFTVDNLESQENVLSGSEFFSKGSKCLIILDAVSTEEKKTYKGSFSITVTKTEKEAQPLELTESDGVIVTIEEDEMTSVLFRPQDSDYYKFDTKIVSDKEKTGYSFVSAIKNEKNKEVREDEGLCYLEAGKTYYIWLSVSDLTESSADVAIAASRVAVIQTDAPGKYSINGNTIIEFKSKDAENYVIYSVSDGDVNGAVYDDKGFPVNKDNDSGGTLSGNDKDFALVLQAQEKNLYLIYASGVFSECTVNIAVYKGDGTSLGPDDIEIPDENKEADDAKGEDSGQENKEDQTEQAQ